MSRKHPLDVQPELHNCSYDGNENLKPAGIVIQPTIEQLIELDRCADSCQYFIDNYIKIVNLDRGLIPFQMYPFQRNIVDLVTENRFSIIKLSRQVGKTTTIASILLWHMLFNKDYTIAILANKEETAKEIMFRLQLSYEHLPKFLQQGVKEFNKKSIVVENGSRIFASATGGSAIRGKTPNFVYLDEFAFVPWNIQEEFVSSVFPTISSGVTAKLCITSTPNGMNKFYEIWTKAVKQKNSFKYMTAHWSEVPGRDEAWMLEQISNTSQRQFDIEYGCEFLGSTSTLIDPRKLLQLEADEPLDFNEHFNVYAYPEPGRSYVITIDCAEGIDLDYTAFAVIDVTTTPYRIAVIYHNNSISPQLLPHVVYDVARKYNDAYVLFETQGHGLTAATILFQDLEYDGVMSTVNQHVGRGGQTLSGPASAGSESRTRLGIQTSKRSKSVGCSTLKTLIENDQLIINDGRTISELSTFIEYKGSWAAEEGKHDDLVMSLVIFAWMTTQSFFVELTNNNVRDQIFAQNARNVEEALSPFGFINTGSKQYGELLPIDPFSEQAFDELWIDFMRDNYPS